MKTVAVLVAALSAAVPLVEATPSATESRAEVTFVSPENFTDAGDRDANADGRRAILAQLGRFLVEQANDRVPAGNKLQVAITDLDLAGHVEPLRGQRGEDVRVVRNLYPPRIALSYRLVDSSGRVLKEGKADLRDTAFLTHLSSGFDDSLRHEKALLKRWLRETLAEKG